METREIVDKMLELVAEKVDARRAEHMNSLGKRYDIATEARMSEDLTIIGMIQGIRNDLWRYIPRD